MSRIGQCPSCRSIFELSDDDVGQVFECECGSPLFAADVAGFTEIPLFCTQCDGEYVVDRDGAGQAVECECGAVMTVPSLVLRQPVSARNEGDAPIQPDANQPNQDDKDQHPIVQCPDCEEQFSVGDDEIGMQAQCACGSVFQIKADETGVPRASKVQPETARTTRTPITANPESDQPLASGNREDSGNRNREPQERERDRTKKRSPVLWIALLVVLPLMILSVTMFAFRKSGVLAKSVTKQQAKPRPAPSPEALIVESAEAASPQPIQAPLESTPKPTPSPEPADLSAESDNSPNATPQPKLQADSIASVGDDPTEVNSNAPRGGLSNQFPPPPKKELPEPKQPRKMVAIISAKRSGLTFDRAYFEAFEAYEKANELEAKAKESGDNVSYHKQLGTTIGLLQQAMDLATSNKKEAELSEIRYLLTYLYFKAGRLPEAAIMAEATLRWGEKAQSSTKEAAFVGLAASQEANQSHWGIATEVGELDQMQSIIKILAKRFPKEEKLDVIRLSLAQSYDRFSQFLKASTAYNSISEDSQHYTTAQLAAGSAAWTQYRILAANPDSSVKQRTALRDRARQFFRVGIAGAVKQAEKPNKQIITTKMALMQLELSNDDYDAAETALTSGPMPLIDSISTDGSGDTVKMSPTFVRQVFETLYSIHVQRNDTAGANKILGQLAERLGDKHASEMGKLYLNAAIDYIHRIMKSDQVNRKQFSTLVEMIEPLKGNNQTLTSANVLWLGESWSKLAEKAASEKLAEQCYAKAAAAYQMAMARDDFPTGSRTSGLVRQAELLRKSGQLSEATKLIGEVLAKTPNAFGLQVEAAQCLQDSALESGRPEQLSVAINGPPDSPIWGWGKLATTLYQAATSEDPNDKNVQRLMQSQYQLANCKYLIAKSTVDPTEKLRLTAELKKLMTRLQTNMKSDVQPWFGKFQALSKQVAALN